MDTLFDIKAIQRAEPNPCIALYGPGPEGVTCKSCTFLLPRTHGSKHWYKCFYRRASYDVNHMGAASTDHRLSWRACGRYQGEEIPT